MNIITHKNEIEISGVSDFDIAKTFECGQCFRWEREQASANSEYSSECNQIPVSYIGIAFGCAARVRQCGDSVFISATLKEFDAVWQKYFDLDRDYSTIREKLCIDDFMQKATDYGKGIRILQQEKWEALCSFIISQNNNIPRIKSIINTLCEKFGNVIMFEGKCYYSFPSAETLSAINAEDLAPLRCGYRAEYIIKAAKDITCGKINLDELADNEPEIARKALKKLHGVGDKVADCVMLFGLHRLDAFPLDVWMKRAVATHYGSDFNPNIFSPYAGTAQQYIFHYMRNG